MRVSIATAAAIALIVSFSGAVSASAAGATKDFSGSTEYHLVPCLSKAELDCVESFGFLNKSGDYVDASPTTTTMTEVVGQNDNPMKLQQSNWTAVVDGEPLNANLDVPLQSPKYVIFKAPDGAPHFGSSLRPSVYSPDLLKLHVRFKIRTSFLIPQNVQLVAEDSDFSQTKIKGGNTWMFEGKGTPVSFYSDYSAPEKKDFSAQADVDSATLHFIVHHGDPDLNRGYWPAVCGDKGYTVQAFNSNSAGSPSWNNATHSLDFAIQSPHSKASGAANTGFFKLWTSDEYINCKWPGNTLSSSAKLEVRIISEDGTTQTALNQVTHKDGKIFVSASGFHYSKPTIKLVRAGTPASKPLKVRTISCAKGKLVATVSGTAPKCPKGYLLKK